jgi:hypothetical protein
VTIIMGVIGVPADLAEALRALLPLIEPVALAIAGALGAGFLFQLGLELGFELVLRALRPPEPS